MFEQQFTWKKLHVYRFFSYNEVSLFILPHKYFNEIFTCDLVSNFINIRFVRKRNRRRTLVNV